MSEDNSSLSSGERAIIENLKIIENFAGIETYNSTDLHNTVNVIIETMEWVTERIDGEDQMENAQELKTPIQVLDLLEFLDTKINFSEKLGDSKISFLIFYNTATCFQILWQLEKSKGFLEKSIELLIKGIHQREAKNSPLIEQVDILKMRYLLVNSFLQNAAILSQLNCHEKALENALNAKTHLKQLMRSINALAESREAIKDSSLGKFYNSSLPKILKTFLNEIETRDPTEKVEEAPKNENGSTMIYWKWNPENNDRYLRRELEKRFGENLIDNKLKAKWLEGFNIGDIMHLKTVNYSELDSANVVPRDILNQDYITRLILVYSCCMFSIATENRFICHEILDKDLKRIKEISLIPRDNQNDQQEGDEERDEDLEEDRERETMRERRKKKSEFNGPIQQSTKNYHLLQNQNFRQSEVYHFKAIEILASFIDDCSLFSHFKSSYHKNYSPNLHIIPEEDEIVMTESFLSQVSYPADEYQQLGSAKKGRRTSSNSSTFNKPNKHSKSREFIDYLKAKYDRPRSEIDQPISEHEDQERDIMFNSMSKDIENSAKLDLPTPSKKINLLDLEDDKQELFINIRPPSQNHDGKSITPISIKSPFIESTTPLTISARKQPPAPSPMKPSHVIGRKLDLGQFRKLETHSFERKMSEVPNRILSKESPEEYLKEKSKEKTNLASTTNSSGHYNKAKCPFNNALDNSTQIMKRLNEKYIDSLAPQNIFKTKENQDSNSPRLEAKITKQVKVGHLVQRTKMKPLLERNDISLTDLIKKTSLKNPDLDKKKRLFLKSKSREKSPEGDKLFEAKITFMKKVKPSYYKLLKDAKKTKKDSTRKGFTLSKKSSNSSAAGERKKKTLKGHLISELKKSATKYLKLRKDSNRTTDNNKTFVVATRKLQKRVSNKFSARAYSDRSMRSPLKTSGSRSPLKLDLGKLKKSIKRTVSKEISSHRSPYSNLHKKNSPLKRITFKTQRSYSTKDRLKNLDLFRPAGASSRPLTTRCAGSPPSHAGGVVGNSSSYKCHLLALQSSGSSRLKTLLPTPTSLSLISSLNPLDCSGRSRKRSRDAEGKGRYFSNLIKNMYGRAGSGEQQHRKVDRTKGSGNPTAGAKGLEKNIRKLLERRERSGNVFGGKAN